MKYTKSVLAFIITSATCLASTSSFAMGFALGQRLGDLPIGTRLVLKKDLEMDQRGHIIGWGDYYYSNEEYMTSRGLMSHRDWPASSFATGCILKHRIPKPTVIPSGTVFATTKNGYGVITNPGWSTSYYTISFKLNGLDAHSVYESDISCHAKWGDHSPMTISEFEKLLAPLFKVEIIGP